MFWKDGAWVDEEKGDVEWRVKNIGGVVIWQQGGWVFSVPSILTNEKAVLCHIVSAAEN